MIMIMITTALPCVTLFYWLFAWPLARTQAVKTIFPNTRTHELAAATVTVLHTWFAAAYCLYYTIAPSRLVGDGREMAFISSVSCTYFVFDTLYLIWRHKTHVVRNKYFGHHILSILMSYAGTRGLFADLGASILLWYGLIEGSNVLLKAWELSKYNQPHIYRSVTPLFVGTYVSCRSVAVSYATYNVWQCIPGDSPLVNTAQILGFIAIVNAFSIWFTWRITKLMAFTVFVHH